MQNTYICMEFHDWIPAYMVHLYLSLARSKVVLFSWEYMITDYLGVFQEIWTNGY